MPITVEDVQDIQEIADNLFLSVQVGGVTNISPGDMYLNTGVWCDLV